jgi:hypothetical protein
LYFYSIFSFIKGIIAQSISCAQDESKHYFQALLANQPTRTNALNPALFLDYMIWLKLVFHRRLRRAKLRMFSVSKSGPSKSISMIPQ